MVRCILINYEKYYNNHCTHIILNWLNHLPQRFSSFKRFYKIFLERSFLTFLHVDVRATCFLCAYSSKGTEDWNYNNSEEREHYVTLCTALYLNSNISHVVTNFLGCCLWVGMDLKAFWSTEEKFEVEILFRVGRQPKWGLILGKWSLIWWQSLTCFECTVVASHVPQYSDPKVSGPPFTSVNGLYFLNKAHKLWKAIICT